MSRTWALGASVALAFATATGGYASSLPVPPQPPSASPIGVPNANAPGELRQLEFLIGNWKAAVVLHKPGGDLAYEARWQYLDH